MASCTTEGAPARAKGVALHGTAIRSGSARDEGFALDVAGDKEHQRCRAHVRPGVNSLAQGGVAWAEAGAGP